MQKYEHSDVVCAENHRPVIALLTPLICTSLEGRTPVFSPM